MMGLDSFLRPDIDCTDKPHNLLAPAETRQEREGLTARLEVRCTPTEKSTWTEEAHGLGLRSVSEYVRARLNNSRPKSRGSKILRILFDPLIIGTLRGAGNNLNQIAHFMHVNQMVDAHRVMELGTQILTIARKMRQAGEP